MKKRTEYAEKNLNHNYPTGHWAAVILLAALIFSVLLIRYYRETHFSAEPAPPPVIFDIQGDVTHPGVYVLADNSATILNAIEAAGGPRNGKMNDIPSAILGKTLSTGKLIHVKRNSAGKFDVQVQPAGGKLRLILGQKLDPNRASEDELILIPSMKREFADAIVARRHSKPWQRLEDLQEIPGVGPKTVQKWTKYLEIQDNQTKLNYISPEQAER